MARSLKNSSSSSKELKATSEPQLSETAVLQRLNKKERLYVEARAAGHSKPAAYKVAGITTIDRKQHHPDANPYVRLALELATKNAMKNLGLKREDVLQGMLDAVRASTSSTELVMAWREIGKIIGAYEPEKVQISHQILMPENLRVMSDADLAKAAGLHGITFDGEYSVA